MRNLNSGIMSYTVEANDNLWSISQKFNTNVYDILLLNSGLKFNDVREGQDIQICQGYEGYNYYKCESTPKKSMSMVGFMNEMRMLWEQHVVWTRFTILSMVENLADVDFVTKRLLENPTDFQEALKVFYGADVAKEFSDLLRSHLLIAADLVNAAKSGDSKSVEAIEKKWYANADEIAAFLAKTNPYWSKKAWQDMLYKHLELTKAEAVELITKDYAASIATFDEIERQAMMMADMMTQGIIRQFPGEFRY